MIRFESNRGSGEFSWPKSVLTICVPTKRAIVA